MGHSHSCLCDNDTTNANDHDTAHGSSYYSYYASKGAKSGSYYHGKGAVDSYYDYGKASKGGNGKGAATSDYYYYYNNNNHNNNNHGKDSKKTKYEKSKGSGKGFSYDDDYVYPTPLPTKAPTTGPKTPSPAGGPPTPTQPTMAPDSGRNNTPNPTSRPTEPKEPVCSVKSNGLYGQKLGLSTEFRFLYQAQVIPSVTVADLNLDIVPKVEVQMGNDLLPKLFPADCRSTSLGAVAGRSSVGGNGNGKRHSRKAMVVDDSSNNEHYTNERYTNERYNDNDMEDNAIVFENAIRGRAQRELQSIISLNGMSIKPRDMVDEDGKQSNPNQIEANLIQITFFLSHECSVAFIKFFVVVWF